MQLSNAVSVERECTMCCLQMYIVQAGGRQTFVLSTMFYYLSGEIF